MYNQPPAESDTKKVQKFFGLVTAIILTFVLCILLLSV
jgi:hypothetical protein